MDHRGVGTLEIARASRASVGALAETVQTQALEHLPRGPVTGDGADHNTRGRTCSPDRAARVKS